MYPRQMCAIREVETAYLTEMTTFGARTSQKRDEALKKHTKKISQHPASPLERYLTIKLHLPLGISFSSLRYPETLARLSNRQWKTAETESFQGWTRAAICYWAIQSSKDKVEKKNISMFFHQTPRSPNACVLCQQLIQVTIRHSNQLDRQSPQALTVLSDNR